MKTINLSARRGYPMFLQIDYKNRTVDFIATETVEVNDVLEIFTPGEKGIIKLSIVKIIESRTPRGDHSDKSALWHRVEI